MKATADDVLFLRAALTNARTDLLPEGGLRVPRATNPGSIWVAVEAGHLERVLDLAEEGLERRKERECTFWASRGGREL